MKTARAHRKFAIYSNFLDTVLEGEEEIRDGETRQDALLRIVRELEDAAAELKRRINPEMCPFPPPHTSMTAKGCLEQVPVISKDAEKLEIDMDNAPDIATLGRYEDRAIKMGMKIQYLRRFGELMSNANENNRFTDGLD
jgi:hypothetical protein